MDFTIKLPNFPEWIRYRLEMVDPSIKSAHFLPIRESFKMERLTRTHIQEVVRLHSIPASIIFGWDSRFTSKFWQVPSENSRNKARYVYNLSSSDNWTKWESYSDHGRHTESMCHKLSNDLGYRLTLIEPSYKINYHTSIQTAPFGTIYSQKYRFPCVGLT